MADTYQTVNCPACGKPMKKIFLPELGVNIDICMDSCGGIFLDNREYKLIDEEHEHLNDIIQAAENNTFNVKVDESATRVCPACGANMVKNPSSVLKEVIIDECYSCGAKFLDHGELTKIRKEFKTEKDRSEAALRTLLYSPEAAELKYLSQASNRVNYKLDKRNHSLLGKLFNKLMDM